MKIKITKENTELLQPGDLIQRKKEAIWMITSIQGKDFFDLFKIREAPGKIERFITTKKITNYKIIEYVQIKGVEFEVIQSQYKEIQKLKQIIKSLEGKMGYTP